MGLRGCADALFLAERWGESPPRRLIPLRVETPSTTKAAIALGSNLGDRDGHLRRAVDAIGRLPGTRLIASSSSHQTAPVGDVAQGMYLNAAVIVRTTLGARALLDCLLDIERLAGRDRTKEQRWGPRTLDLDLILYGDAAVAEPGLIVPHPRMHERAFVLAPLAEIAPAWIVPGQGRTVADLLARLASVTDRGETP